MTINTILEKFESLRRNYLDVEIENREADPEYEIDVNITCIEGIGEEEAYEELLAELAPMAIDTYKSFCHTEYVFECEGKEYSVNVWYEEK